MLAVHFCTQDLSIEVADKVVAGPAFANDSTGEARLFELLSSIAQPTARQRAGLPAYSSLVFGLVKEKQGFAISKDTEERPQLVRVLNSVVRSLFGAPPIYTTLRISWNFPCGLDSIHVDACNFQPARVACFYPTAHVGPGPQAGRIFVHPDTLSPSLDILDCRLRFAAFDGQRPHGICPYEGERVSISVCQTVERIDQIDRTQAVTLMQRGFVLRSQFAQAKVEEAEADTASKQLRKAACVLMYRRHALKHGWLTETTKRRATLPAKRQQYCARCSCDACRGKRAALPPKEEEEEEEEDAEGPPNSNVKREFGISLAPITEVPTISATFVFAFSTRH